MKFEPDEKILKITRLANNPDNYKKWCEKNSVDFSTFGKLNSKYGDYVKEIAAMEKN